MAELRRDERFFRLSGKVGTAHPTTASTGIWWMVHTAHRPRVARLVSSIGCVDGRGSTELAEVQRRCTLNPCLRRGSLPRLLSRGNETSVATATAHPRPRPNSAESIADLPHPRSECAGALWDDSVGERLNRTEFPGRQPRYSVGTDTYFVDEIGPARVLRQSPAATPPITAAVIS
jgi:hypothetical protein